MGTEVERKYRLEQAPEWLSEWPAAQVRQGYLAIAGEVEVRVRAIDDERLLTVKRGHGEVRAEVEIHLDDEQFDALWPLTDGRRVSKRRFRVPLDDANATAEVDVFEGELEGLVVAEVEFRSEAEAHAFEAPGWLGSEVTGDDRYANQELASGRAPAAGDRRVHLAAGSSRAYRLKRSETVPAGVRRIAAGRAANAVEQLSAAYGGDPEAVHEARKDLKKLRSLLRLVRAEVGEEIYASENTRFRDAGRLLAGARDAEVKLETLRALRERDDEVPAAAIETLEARLERERHAESANLGAAAAAIAAGHAAIDSWPVDHRGWKAVEPGLRRSYRRGRKRMKSVTDEPTAANVHDWRKRAKDLWYQLRLIQRAWPALMRETADQVHELTDLLGDHHDLEVLAEEVRADDELGRVPEERERVLSSIARRQDELLGAALALGRRVYAEEPGALSARVGAYWSAPRPSRG